jgi:hypothetical protein
MKNMSTTVNRMRLDEVVSWFSQRGYKSTASYFMSLINEDCTTLYRNAYWIETETLRRHLGYPTDRLFKELECDVTTWMPNEA